MNYFESPKIVIDGAVFAIDSNANSLIDQSNHANIINLNNNQIFQQYRIVYDKEHRNLAKGNYSMPEDYYRLTEVRLPVKITTLNSIPVDEDIKMINQEAHTNGWNFALVDRALNERLAGRLPKLDISGDLFTVQWEHKKLNSDTTFKPLNFDDFDMSPDGTKYLFFYHKPSQTIFYPESDISEFPKDTYLVEIDNEITLDPVAAARHFGLEEAAFYPEHPVILNHVAKIIPFEETRLAELVEQNRTQHGSETRDRRKRYY